MSGFPFPITDLHEIVNIFSHRIYTRCKLNKLLSLPGRATIHVISQRIYKYNDQDVKEEYDMKAGPM